MSATITVTVYLDDVQDRVRTVSSKAVAVAVASAAANEADPTVRARADVHVDGELVRQVERDADPLLTMRTTVTVETNALPANASRIAAEALGVARGASQGGRLGCELTLPRDEAERVAAELREYGYKAWIS